MALDENETPKYSEPKPEDEGETFSLGKRLLIMMICAVLLVGFWKVVFDHFFGPQYLPAWKIGLFFITIGGLCLVALMLVGRRIQKSQEASEGIPTKRRSRK